jgi:hypothetical protein
MNNEGKMKRSILYCLIVCVSLVACETENTLFISRLNSEIEKAAKGMRGNEQFFVVVDNSAKSDALVMCRAYASKEAIESGDVSKLLNQDIYRQIYSAVNQNDGVYLFQMKAGKLQKQGMLNSSVDLKDFCVVAQVGDSVEIRLRKISEAHRPIVVEEVR